MGGFSWLARRPAAAGDPTHALSAAQSHSIVDNLVALFEHSRAWNCSNQERAPARQAAVLGGAPASCAADAQYPAAARNQTDHTIPQVLHLALNAQFDPTGVPFVA